MLVFSSAIFFLFFSFALVWLMTRWRWRKFNPTQRPKIWAQEIKNPQLQNFHKVSDHLFRSAQPSKLGMLELKKLGFKSVLNLRHIKKDEKLVDDNELKLIHLSINTWTLSKKEILKGVSLIKNAEKPVLVHCLHGSDRTGAIIAAFRILEMDWSAEDAIAELKFGGFGYHQFYFPHILWLLVKLK